MRDLFKNKLFIFLVIALVILGGLAAFTAGNRAAVTWAVSYTHLTLPTTERV